MLQIRPLAVVIVLAPLCLQAAWGHDSYLMATKTQAKGAQIIFTSAEKFPSADYGPKMARIANTFVEGPDNAAKFRPVKDGARSMKLSLTASTSGTYVVGLELLPKNIDLTPDKVNEYFEEIDPPDAIRKSFFDLPAPRSWHETYVKYAKTVLCLRSCGDTLSMMRPSGLKAEFLLQPPEKPGARERFVLVRNGEPVSGLSIAVTDMHGKKTIMRADDRGTIELPASARGQILLSAVILELPETGKQNYQSTFVTLTLDTKILRDAEGRPPAAKIRS